MKIIDEEYLAFVRARRCFWCGEPPPSDPDHLRNRKWRESTRNDYTALPSCRDCHTRRGNVGSEKMLELNGVKIWSLVETIAMQLVEFHAAKYGQRIEVPL